MSESFEQAYSSLPPRDIDAGNASTSKNPDRPLPIISTPTSSTVSSSQPPEEVVEISKVMLQGLRPPQQDEEETASIKTRAPTPTPTVGQGAPASTTAAKADHTSSTESQIQSHHDPKPNPSAPWHRIRLEPHAPHHTIPSLHFNNLTHDLQEGAPPLWIGRFTHTSLHSDKIAFRSKVVSRNHAELWVGVDGKFYIRDTASSSGTFVNYERLSRANEKSDPFQIRDGDILQLGVNYQGGQESIYQNVGIRVHIEGPISPPSAARGFSLGSEEGRGHNANITSPSGSSLSPSTVTTLSKSPVSTDEMKGKKAMNGVIEDDVGSRRRQAIAEHMAKLNEIKIDGVRETHAFDLSGFSLPAESSNGHSGTRSGDQGNLGQLNHGVTRDEGIVGGTGEGEEEERARKESASAKLVGMGGVTGVGMMPRVPASPAMGGAVPASELGASRDGANVVVDAGGSEVETARYEDASAVFKYLAMADSEARTQNVQDHSDHLDSDQPKAQAPRDAFVSAPAQDSEESVAQLLHARVLSSKDSYKNLLEAKDTEAQRILDLLQNLLNSPRVVGDTVRGSILTALLRLSASSGLYPEQLRLHDIEKESSPVTAGQFGEIWKGEYHGRPVCLKIFKLYQRSEIDYLLKRCSREAIVWSQLVHPNLLPFYGIYHLGDAHGRVGLVSPWMGNGNLSEYLKARPESRRLPFVHDILAGLRYLHRHQVVHGDLKGVNILITADGSACLADFGLSSVMDADVLRWTSLVTITQIGGTVRWMAPEMIEAAEDGPSHPTLESDIYSLASVMFEAFTGQVPYYEFPRDLTVLSKVTQGIKPRRPSNEVAPELTDPIWKIMIDCWSDTPGDRPTIDQVISDISVQTVNASRGQPAQVELRNPRSPAGTLTKSDMTFLMNLLNVG